MNQLMQICTQIELERKKLVTLFKEGHILTSLLVVEQSQALDQHIVEYMRKDRNLRMVKKGRVDHV